MRPIDADSLLSKIKNPYEYAAVARWVNAEPTIIPARKRRKRGKWERHYSRPNVYADLFWHCSVCGFKNDNDFAHRFHKFCPNCGAEMDRGEQK